MLSPLRRLGRGFRSRWSYFSPVMRFWICYVVVAGMTGGYLFGFDETTYGVPAYRPTSDLSPQAWAIPLFAAGVLALVGFITKNLHRVRMATVCIVPFLFYICVSLVVTQIAEGSGLLMAAIHWALPTLMGLQILAADVNTSPAWQVREDS